MARPLVGTQLFQRVFKFNNKKQFSTSSVCYRRNFRQFPLYNFRGTMAFKKQQKENPDPDIPIHTYGVRKVTLKINGKQEVIKEMIPELIVPDLTDFPLKPYVSYRADDVTQGEFTSKDLFDAIYSSKIQKDFKAGKLDENGNPLEPNEFEKMTAEEAAQKARQTGSDIF